MMRARGWALLRYTLLALRSVRCRMSVSVSNTSRSTSAPSSYAMVSSRLCRPRHSRRMSPRGCQMPRTVSWRMWWAYSGRWARVCRRREAAAGELRWTEWYSRGTAILWNWRDTTSGATRAVEAEGERSHRGRGGGMACARMRSMSSSGRLDMGGWRQLCICSCFIAISVAEKGETDPALWVHRPKLIGCSETLFSDAMHFPTSASFISRYSLPRRPSRTFH